MVAYEVTVSTAYFSGATTVGSVFIKLVGTDGESERKWLMGFKGAATFMKGAVSLKCVTGFLNFAYVKLLNNSLEKLRSAGYVLFCNLRSQK